MINKSDFIEEELSYKLRGIFMEISKTHGCLFKEKVYQNLVSQRLKLEKINFQQFPQINLYDSVSKIIIGHFYPDFLVADKIIIEIKAQNQLLNQHINQLIKYLCFSKYELGFIANFGSPRVQIIRRVYANGRKSFLLN